MDEVSLSTRLDSAAMLVQEWGLARALYALKARMQNRKEDYMPCVSSLLFRKDPGKTLLDLVLIVSVGARGLYNGFILTLLETMP